MPRTPALLLSLLAALAIGSAHAQKIYKWVDEQGRTHYSESPPPEVKAKAKEVKVDTTPPSGPDTPRPVERSWQEKELESREKRVRSAEDARKDEEAAKVTAARKQRCDAAQESLRRLYMEVPVYTKDADGQRRYLEEKDREAEIGRWKKIVAENC